MIEPEKYNAYVVQANEAAYQFIHHMYTESDPCVDAFVTIFQTMCSKGGIMMTKQKEILIKQALRHFELTTEDAVLAAEEPI